MYETIISGLLLLIGIIHLLPLSGVISSERLAMLYDITLEDSNLEILMRHRAVLFGLLGAFFVYAAFDPSIQPIAFVAAFVSIAFFFWLSLSVGGYNEAIRRVIIADVVAAVSLVAAIVLYYFKG